MSGALLVIGNGMVREDRPGVIGLGVVTDGRWGYLERALTAAQEFLPGVDAMVVVNDSGQELPIPILGAEIVNHPERRGLAAAVQSVWDHAAAQGWDYLFHLEEDFVLTEPVELARMANVLQRVPRLASLTLKRQPWSPQEVAAGGQIELCPDEYEERHIAGAFVCFHEPTGIPHVFSLNPSLIPRRTFSLGWPAGNEAGFTEQCAEQGWRLAYWGRKSDPPRCLHIGERRSHGWQL